MDNVFEMVVGVLDNLKEAEMLDKDVIITKSTVLIGPDAVLDSISFVTLFTDLEDVLSEKTGEETYLLIDEVHAFNPEKTFLTVGVLCDYIENMLKG